MRPGQTKPQCPRCQLLHWYFEDCDKGETVPVQVGYDTIQAPSDYRPPKPGKDTGYRSVHSTTHYRTMTHERNIERAHYKEEER